MVPTRRLGLAASLSEAIAAPVSVSLQELAETKMEPAAIACTLELLASAYSDRPSIGDLSTWS